MNSSPPTAVPSALASAATAAIGMFLSTAAAIAAPPPNVVLIVTDDQAWNTLAYMPKLQSQLASQGVTFTNAFAGQSLCCPSRATILTGRYPHNHGVLGNDAPFGGALAFYDASTLPVWLQESGYRTGLFGKYFNGYSYSAFYTPPGWDEWQTFQLAGYYNYRINANGTTEDYGRSESNYSTDVLTQKAVAFITNSAASDKPFFLFLAPFAPHAPYTPAPRHAGRYADVPPWRPPNYNEQDVSDKPTWVQKLRPASPQTQTDYDKERQAYLEMLLAVDDGVESILKALESTGQRENTLVIFTSDNGLTWGEHRWWEKGCSYEESLRVPMVVSFPGVSTAARQEELLVLNMDLTATIAEAAGIAIPATVDGRSLLPILKGQAVSWREQFLFEGWQLTPTHAGVRSTAWKYMENLAGEQELYNLIGDPYELDNAVGVADYGAQVAELQTTLAQMRYSTKGMAPYLLVHSPSFGNNLLEKVGENNPAVLRTDMTAWPNRYRVYRKSARDGGLLGQMTYRDDLFPEVEAIALPDVNGNGAYEVAVQSLSADKSGRLIEVRDSLSGALIREVRPSGDVGKLDVYPDLGGNGYPEIAVLSGKEGRIELFDTRTGRKTTVSLGAPPAGGLAAQEPATFGWIPDINGNGKPEFVVLWLSRLKEVAGSQQPADPYYQVIDPLSKQTLSSVTLQSVTGVPDLVGLPDLSGNGAPEVAVLQGNAPVSVTVKDSKTGTTIATLDYPGLVYARAMAMVAAEGGPEIAVLGTGQAHANQVILKGIASGASRQITFDKNFLARDLEVLADTNGSGKAELAVLLANPDSGVLKLQLRDAGTGELVRDIPYP
ncbi:sulfatase [Gloeobacter morelensis]|uniref:Sulfatase n=1 Tax=Gloeobacter morelensis MG652769 TaxID=2781736 RepID=A0ABY3PI07_9CYAN|nr:sulfatase [Gloeobacter morelensis]UFP93261.1 sulfatase [Gloeobacter morelensis MG652769]